MTSTVLDGAGYGNARRRCAFTGRMSSSVSDRRAGGRCNVQNFARRHIDAEQVGDELLAGYAQIEPDSSTELVGSGARGGGRESNPPGSSRPHTGFEDRGAHQAP
jgi:hypothetical protein